MATASISSTIALPSCTSLHHNLSKSHPPPSLRPLTFPKSPFFSLSGLQPPLQQRKHLSLFFNASKNSLQVQAALKNVDSSKVVPQADRVLVRLEELPEKSMGGVLLPKSAVKFERYLVGEVISVGKDIGTIEKGQKVLFSDLNAYEVDLGTTEKLCFCKAGDLLAVVA